MMGKVPAEWRPYVGQLESKLETAEQKIDRLKAAMAESCDDQRYEFLGGCVRANKAEQQLRDIGALPDKWRDISEKQTQAYTDMYGCADELQSILNRSNDDDNWCMPDLDNLNKHQGLVSEDKYDELLDKLEAAEQQLRDIERVCNCSDDYTRDGVVNLIDDILNRSEDDG